LNCFRTSTEVSEWAAKAIASLLIDSHFVKVILPPYAKSPTRFRLMRSESVDAKKTPFQRRGFIFGKEFENPIPISTGYLAGSLKHSPVSFSTLSLRSQAARQFRTLHPQSDYQ
jgi:hypothetical protein